MSALTRANSGALRFLTCAAAWLGIVATTGSTGCGTSSCEQAAQSEIVVVLTFDDGPISADIADPLAQSSEELLRPLRTIIETLDRRGVQAVFFVEGPGDASSGDSLREVYAEGLLELHEAGHTLGYHGYNHELAVWSTILSPPVLGRLAMDMDLDRLELYLDQALALVGLVREEVFAPLFRQPGGGSGLSRLQGYLEAPNHGWNYRGYLIDSVDWTDNADVDPALHVLLPWRSEAERVDFVRRRLRAGAARNYDRAVVDVVLHVNDFTARSVDIWIDELRSAFEGLGAGRVAFDVPDCYLTSSDATVDRSFVPELLSGLFAAVD